MTTANRITMLRVILSPFFFIAYFLPVWTGLFQVASVIALWLMFGVIEISDLVDGKIARDRNQVTETGKLFDPFADVIARLTYFLCFALSGLMPGWIFVIFLYREMGIIFLRMMLVRSGFAMGARKGGKLKAVSYSVAGILGMIRVSLDRFGLFTEYQNLTRWILIGFFCLAAAASVLSFIDYLRFAREKMRRKDGTDEGVKPR